jgi:hypothetical protein
MRIAGRQKVKRALGNPILGFDSTASPSHACVRHRTDPAPPVSYKGRSGYLGDRWLMLKLALNGPINSLGKASNADAERNWIAPEERQALLQASACLDGS